MASNTTLFSLPHNPIFDVTIPMPVHVVYAIVEVIIALTAAIGNSLVIIVFIKNSRIRTVTNSYVISLAVADFLVATVGIPSAILNSVGLPRDFEACLFVNSLLLVLCTGSILALVAITMDRFYAVVYPFRYHINMTWSRGVLINIICWVLASIVGFLPSMGWNLGKPPKPRCHFMEVMDLRYLVFVYIVTLVAPMLFMACVYIKIFHEVRRQVRRAHMYSLSISSSLFSVVSRHPARPDTNEEGASLYRGSNLDTLALESNHDHCSLPGLSALQASTLNPIFDASETENCCSSTADNLVQKRTSNLSSTSCMSDFDDNNTIPNGVTVTPCTSNKVNKSCKCADNKNCSEKNCNSKTLLLGEETTSTAASGKSNDSQSSELKQLDPVQIDSRSAIFNRIPSLGLKHFKPSSNSSLPLPQKSSTLTEASCNTAATTVTSPASTINPTTSNPSLSTRFNRSSSNHSLPLPGALRKSALLSTRRGHGFTQSNSSNNISTSTLHPSLPSRGGSNLSTPPLILPGILPGSLPRHSSVRSPGVRSIRSSESRTAVRLALVVLLFVLSWFPLYTFNFTMFLCREFNKTCPVSDDLIKCAVILSHLNSTWNPALYAWAMSDFMTGIKRLFSSRNMSN